MVDVVVLDWVVHQVEEDLVDEFLLEDPVDEVSKTSWPNGPGQAF